MFADHQPKLAKLGRATPDGFERIVTFVLCTIRQPLHIACMDYKRVRQGDERSLFGSKFAGLDYVRRHAAELLERCEYAYEHSDDSDAENIICHILNEIPGIGPAKAGFICQILYGLSGCIDTHNLKRFGLAERHFRGREGKRETARHRKLTRDYNAFCRNVGGTEKLWNDWCAYVAEREPINYQSAEFVSQLHLVPLEC